MTAKLQNCIYVSTWWVNVIFLTELLLFKEEVGAEKVLN